VRPADLKPGGKGDGTGKERKTRRTKNAMTSIREPNPQAFEETGRMDWIKDLNGLGAATEKKKKQSIMFREEGVRASAHVPSTRERERG